MALKIVEVSVSITKSGQKCHHRTHQRSNPDGSVAIAISKHIPQGIAIKRVQSFMLLSKSAQFAYVL